MSLTDKNPFDLMSEKERLNLQRITVLTEQLASQYKIDNMEFLRMQDPVTMLESIIVRMTKRLAYIPGEETITVPKITQKAIWAPATWWDAFKERHFDVLLRWFPVNYRLLQDSRVLQYEQTYEPRQYLPDLVLPKGHTSEIYRFQPLTSH